MHYANMSSINLIVTTEEQLRTLIKEALVELECCGGNQQTPNNSQAYIQQEFVSLKEACSILNISKTSLYHLRKRGDLPFSRINRKVYVSKQDIHILLDSKKNQLPHISTNKTE